MPTITEAAARRKALLDRFDLFLSQAETLASEPGKLADLDNFVRQGMLTLGEEVVAQAVTAAGPGLRKPDRLPTCPCCKEHRLEFKQYRSTRLRTALSGKPQDVLAPVAVCPGNCSVSLNLLRQAMKLDADGRTPHLRHLATIAGTIEPFEAASSRVLGELAGITMSANGVHGICQEAGAVAQDLMKRGQLGKIEALDAGDILYVMADGCMLWVDDGWHEVKFAVIFKGSANVEVSKDRHMTTERLVICTLGDRDDLGAMVWRAVEPLLPRNKHGCVVIKDRIVFLSDGSAWLRSMVDEHLPGAFVLLDWYHMAQHVAETAKVLYGSDELGAYRWRKEQESLLMEGRVSAMLAGLERLGQRKDLSATARESVAGLHAFLDKRRDSLKYCEAKARGYLIGSGPAESAANHVVQQRMKRAGMRWDSAGAEAMLALRAAWRSAEGFERLRQAA